MLGMSSLQHILLECVTWFPMGLDHFDGIGMWFCFPTHCSILLYDFIRKYSLYLVLEVLIDHMCGLLGKPPYELLY